MKIRILVVTIIVFWLVGVGTASADIIYVPDEYSTIQEAVDNANASDTIIVRDGTYNIWNVEVGKELTIKSENGSSSCTIDGTFVLNVGCTVQGFTFEGTQHDEPAIKLNANHNTIKDNVFIYGGLFVDSSFSNTVENNTIDGKPLVYLECESDKKVLDAGQVILVNCYNIEVDGLELSNARSGIELWGTSDSIISNNNITGNCDGIYQRNGYNITIEGNNIVNNNCNGIYSYESWDNKVISNNISFNKYEGMDLGEYDSNVISSNNISNNGGVISKDERGITISGNNNTISHNIIQNNEEEGFGLKGSNNNISKNNITYNGRNGGIFLGYGSSNHISKNFVAYNDNKGIDISGNTADNNIIENNIIINNRYYGLIISDYKPYLSGFPINNIIQDNVFVNNGIIIGLTENKLSDYHNCIVNNTVNGKPIIYLERESDKKISGAGQVILIKATNITIENSSITRVNNGIQLMGTENVVIRNNEITENNQEGISQYYSEDVSITNNNISNNYAGIHIHPKSVDDYSACRDTTISCNYFNNSKRYGIKIWGAINCSITENIITNTMEWSIHISGKNHNITKNYVNNSNYGISLGSSENCTVSANTITNNNDGITIGENAEGNYILDNELIGNNLGFYFDFYYHKFGCLYNHIVGNTVNGDTYHHFLNEKDTILKDVYVDEPGMSNLGQVTLVNCTNVTLTNLSLKNNSNGLYLFKSDYNTIMNSNFSFNNDGIHLHSSNNNTVYLNNFVGNSDNVYSDSSTNIWNSTEEKTYTYNGSTFTNYLGNYWDNYTGSDTSPEDGIGDTPYTIDGDNDSYPLMQPFEDYKFRIVDDIKFNGTVTNMTVMVGATWWDVSVDEVISGPDPCSSEIEVALGSYPPMGYVDSNISVGDRVEVFGNYTELNGCVVSLNGESYYIIKIDGEPKNPYDANQDCTMSMSELFTAIEDWKKGELGMGPLFEVIECWKKGEYC